MLVLVLVLVLVLGLVLGLGLGLVAQVVARPLRTAGRRPMPGQTLPMATADLRRVAGYASAAAETPTAKP